MKHNVQLGPVSVPPHGRAGHGARRSPGSAPRPRSAACSFCGKNLIKNPGAENGRGQNAAGEVGRVPGWTSTAGQFGAAAYTGFGVGWFSAASKGPKPKGKNYFFGGTTTAATGAKATSGRRRSSCPPPRPGTRRPSAAGSGTTASNTTQVRAEFTDATGKVLSAIRIGPDTTIGGEDMAFRTPARHGAGRRGEHRHRHHVHRPRQLQPRRGGRRSRSSSADAGGADVVEHVSPASRTAVAAACPGKTTGVWSSDQTPGLRGPGADHAIALHHAAG